MRSILWLMLLLSWLPAHAQQAAPCSTPEYRQFDYWLGEWDVFNADGTRIGENRITQEQGGCVLHEHWMDQRGGTGESFNIYDGAATGNLLLLDGGIDANGNMVLSGEQRRSDGNVLHNRISWLKQEDGSVQQLWEQSTDGGKTWQTGFLGIYRRKGS